MPEASIHSSLAFHGWTILFDLDGTLVETAPDLVMALNYSIQKNGLSPTSVSEVRAMIGDGARALIRKAHDLQGVALNDATEDSLFEILLSYYGAHIADRSYPFEGIIDALEALQSAGARLGVCTNKMQTLAESLLSELALTQYFTAILGRDRASRHKPDPAHVLETIIMTGGSPERAILIGDSLTDARAAKAANIPFVFLEYGYHGGHVNMITADLVLPNADALFSELNALIVDIDSGR